MNQACSDVSMIIDQLHVAVVDSDRWSAYSQRKFRISLRLRLSQRIEEEILHAFR